jgi:hypothetical protein
VHKTGSHDPFAIIEKLTGYQGSFVRIDEISLLSAAADVYERFGALVLKTIGQVRPQEENNYA